MQPYELRAEQLYHVCDDSLLDFETTSELPDLADILGQERALGALHLGVGMRHEGYNLYVMGSPGLGKHAIVRNLLQQRAARPRLISLALAPATTLQLICYRRLSDCLGCGLDPNWLACHWSLAAVYTAAHSVRKTNMSSIEDLNAQSLKGHQGLKRILRALGYSIAGIRAAVAGEAAFRQLLLLNAVLIPLAFTFEVSRIERVLLVIVPLLTLVIELVNSAIEATIDRISYELHPLSKNAKDMGSAAQLLSLVVVAVTWVMILY